MSPRPLLANSGHLNLPQPLTFHAGALLFFLLPLAVIQSPGLAELLLNSGVRRNDKMLITLICLLSIIG